MKNGIKEKKLSKRELQVLLLICKEFTPAMIARKLNIHEKTFFTHRAHIWIKTNSKTNIGVLRYAICSGLFKDPKLKAKKRGVL